MAEAKASHRLPTLIILTLVRSARRQSFPGHQEFKHLGRALKLLDARGDGIALNAGRQARKLMLEQQPLRLEALLECVGLRPSSHGQFGREPFSSGLPL